MIKRIRKLFILALSVLLLFSLSATSSAAEVEDNSIEGMDAHFSLESNGTIFFNTDAALTAGYSATAVMTVKERIDYLNSLVLSGEAFINENFGAVISCSHTRSSNDVSYIVENWDGTIDVYLSDEDTKSMKSALSYAQQGLDPRTFITDLPFRIQGYALAACLAGNVQAQLYKQQIINAESYGTGVVMHIFYIDGTQYITFYAQ